jgi:HD-GYP domain-containing protein (c-di-GMP phosphodiesterase class II)
VGSVESVPAAVVDGDTSLVARARADSRLRPETRAALVAGAAAGGFLVVSGAFLAFLPAHRGLDVATAALLVVAFALVNQVRFEVGSVYALPTQLVFVPMALTIPARMLPVAVGLGALLGGARGLATRETPLTRAPLLLGASWYAVGPAIVLAAAGDPDPAWRHWPLYLLALGVQFVFDFVVGAFWTKAAYGVSAFGHVREVLLPFFVDASLAPLALSIGLRVNDQRASILLVLPLVGLLAFFARERQVRIDHALELSTAYRGTALLLGDVIEADDAYTGSHSRDVVELTVAVADRLGLDAAQRHEAELVALLHDVGKVKIPAEIINKPGPLDAAERAIINTHTIEGERMLEQIGGLLGRVGRIVRSCHERWDGGGYPDGLAGEDIPLIARIVCCCDAFNAMTTDRPYRMALPLEEAKAELERTRGTQFDPQVVDALLAIG